MQRLSEETIRLIRSTSSITSVSDIAMALLDNSIDAGATRFRLEVTLDPPTVAAKDNGCGIPAADMAALGQRYFTSKHAMVSHPERASQRPTIGYRGEDVISRTSTQQTALRCAVRDEKQLFLESSDNPEILQGYSTIVNVRGIFSAHPVRRQIAIESAKKIVDEIKAQLQTRSLGCPDISIQFVKLADKRPVFAYSATESLNQRIAQVYGPSIAQYLDFIVLDYKGYRLRGSMSRTPIFSRIQHVFYGRSLWNPPELLSIIRAALTGSDYMSKSVVLDSTRSKQSSPRVKALFPMFVVSITSEPASSDSLSSLIDYRTRRDGFKITQEIKQLVVLACIKFLRKLGMISDAQMRSTMKLASGLYEPTGNKRQFECIQQGAEEGGTDGNTGSCWTLLAGSLNVRPTGALAEGSDSKAESFGSRARRTIPFVGMHSDSLQTSIFSENRSEQQPLNVATLRVVGQADRKFIMCQDQGRWLVAIDQHAADERIRLEASYRSLNRTVEIVAGLPAEQSVSRVEGISVLVPPASVLLSRHNAEVVLGLRARFRALGFQLAGHTAPARPSDAACIQLACVPTVLAPRLHGADARSDGGSARGGDGGFIKELLLSIASWCLEHQTVPDPRQRSQQGGSQGPAGRPGAETGWPFLIGIPDIIMETLKSIACRGAVKFNERQSMAECQSIVARLAECRFPAFCAHGR
ncbi:DNA mismatch repair protein [Coemansia sp. Benny D115]|nr:DNA mismatch repair protein [Coemansia sp. Benny D115]